MTTAEKFESILVSMGMFETQAKEVMKLAIPKVDATVPDYKFTWDRPADEYPEQLYTVVFHSVVKETARQWIKDNAPMAWYAPMFE